MSDNYEVLTCEKCKKTFTGRKLSESGVAAVCPECIAASEISLFDPNAKGQFPAEVLAELDGGKGDDE